MANVEKVSITLTAEMAAAVRKAVESGEYASTSEVMRDALRDWQTKRTISGFGLAEIGHAWREGLASGPTVAGPAAMAKLRKRYKRRP
jgi:antitoxin ParD1/3/4